MSDSDRDRKAKDAGESSSLGAYQRRRPITESDLESAPPSKTSSEVVRKSTAPRTDPSPPRRSRYDTDPADYDDYLPSRDPNSSRSSGQGGPSRDSASRSASSEDEYVERVRRGSARYEDDFESASPSSRDPYDRLRRTQSRPPRRVEPEYN